METTAPRTLHNAEWVARRLGVRLHRVYELIRTDRLPAVRIGRQVRVDPAALEDWIANGGAGLDEDIPPAA